tara:strand:- start:728 stop:1417 length:690 start_codon:yes stop_codon:yes gene_type:complete
MEPDVLIIDEVLAVGDLGFRLKCFKSIDEILPNTAIIFVSHNMSMVSRICSHILLMSYGKEQYCGIDTSKGIDLYYSRFKNDDDQVIFDDGSLELQNIQLLGAELLDNSIPILNWQDDFNLDLEFKVNKPIVMPMFKIVIYDKEQRPVAMLYPNKANNDITITNNILSFTVTHRSLELSKGLYSISMTVFKHKSLDTILGLNHIIQFQVTHNKDYYHPFLLSAKYINSK